MNGKAGGTVTDTSDAFDQSQSPLRRFWPIARPPVGRGALALLLAVLAAVCAIGLIGTSGWLISRAAQQPPILALALAVVAVRAFGIGRGVFRYGERLVSHDAALGGLARLRAVVVARLAVLAPAGLSGMRRGDALRRVVDDVDSTAEFSLRVILPGSTAVLVGGATVAFVAWLVPVAGLGLLAGLLTAGLLVPWVSTRAATRATASLAGVRGELAAQISTQFTGCADLVAANAAVRSTETIRRTDHRLRDLESRAARGLGTAAGLGVLAQGAALLAVILTAIPAVRSGELAGVDLAVVVLIPLATFELITTLPTAALAWANLRASTARVADLIDQPDPVPDPAHPLATPIRHPAPRLAVDSLQVTWPTANRPAVWDVSFVLESGRSLAIVGPSGSGKSTLAAALVRFLPYQGSIRLGGCELKDLAGDSVREIVCLAGQEAHIFDNNIAENVRLAHPGAKDDAVSEALRQAGLAPWIETLPEGIRTRVGQHGATVSGGQRQRIALARVLLARPAIAVFDEPTEHLDSRSARQLMTDLLGSPAGRSTIVISHQLLGLEAVDEVIVLRDGVIVERGTSAALLAGTGWFAAQHRRQLAALRDQEITLLA